jgi:hypothetical protein
VTVTTVGIDSRSIYDNCHGLYISLPYSRERPDWVKFKVTKVMWNINDNDQVFIKDNNYDTSFVI